MESNTTNTIVEKKGNIDDLLAWQKAKELAVCAYKIIQPIDFDELLKDRLLQSAMEIPHGVARSYGVRQRERSLEYLYQSREQIFEFKTSLAICTDIGLLSLESTASLVGLMEHSDKLISGLIQYKEEGKKRRPFTSRRDVDGNANQDENTGNSLDYTSSPVSNF